MYVGHFVAVMLGMGILWPELYLYLTRGTTRKHQDRSLLALWGIIIPLTAVACVLAGLRWPSWACFELFTFDMTLIYSLYAGGIILRTTAIRHMGNLFTVDVSVSPTQWILMTGPFALVRHPSYAGLLASLVAFSFSLGHWAGPILIGFGAFLAFAQRIRVEEAALESAAGSIYQNYQARTWKLFPWVW